MEYVYGNYQSLLYIIHHYREGDTYHVCIFYSYTFRTSFPLHTSLTLLLNAETSSVRIMRSIITLSIFSSPLSIIPSLLCSLTFPATSLLSAAPSTADSTNCSPASVYLLLSTGRCLEIVV